MNRRRAAFVVLICAASLGWHDAAPDAAGPHPDDAVAIDLTAGALTQSNCQTVPGCGHPDVVLTKDSFVSSGTAASLAQHILTLQFPNPLASIQGRGPYTLELEYEFSNPSGHKSNRLCASALVGGRLVQRCANPY